MRCESYSRSVFAEHPWLTLAPALRWAVHRHLSLDAMYRTGAEAEHLRHTQNARAFAQLALCFAFDLAVYLWAAKPLAARYGPLKPGAHPLADHRALKFRRTRL
jgi:hypothetical protein